MRYNGGKCYFCDLSVYCSDGQLIKFILKNNKEYPTHKLCRKKNGRRNKSK